MSQKRWKEAEEQIESFINEMDEKQNPVILTEIYYDLGKIAYESHNNIKAQLWLNQAVSIDHAYNQHTLRDAYNLLSLISYLHKEYELSYHHLRISNMIADQINAKAKINKLYELQVKYKSIDDKQSIEQLIEISELKDQERQKSKSYFLITFFLFIITLGVAIALARQARLKQKQSEELQSQIEDNLNKTKDLIKAHKLAEEGLKVKSEFIAMVSHEIRTPMNAIIGMSSLLSDTELTNYQNNYLNNISISSNNLLLLLNDILDFSRVEAGKVSIKLQPSHLDKELKHVVNMFEPLAKEKELEFSADLDDKIPNISFIDAPRLRQVVVNLLSNAIKFTHQGFVKLSVTVIKSEPTLNGEMVTIRFKVADTGIGVPKDKQDEIFSSFNQLDSKVSRQYSGVGLGLSISQGILGMMGSQIQLESEFAKGSTFWFDLKVKSDKKSSQKKILTTQTKVKFDKELGITCPLRILVAEDNEINQKLIQINLNKMGYNPIIVSNGQEALDQIKIQDFDIVFMDVQMPVMDGVSATKEIVRRYGKEKPVIIAVTANAMGTDKQSYIQAGMDDYISKPFTTKEIDSCLRNWYTRLNN
jgi:signal transduction histidine kinase/CheY-like chemotaxis protein